MDEAAGDEGRVGEYAPWQTRDEHVAAALRRRAARADPGYFAHRYLKHERWAWLDEFDRALDDPSSWLKVVKAPVDHGKSMRLIARVLHRICVDRPVRIAWVMWTGRRAVQRVRRIREVLLNNQTLIRDWWDPEHGPFFRSSRDAGEGGQFQVRCGSRVQGVATPTLTAIGLKENFEGEKYDLIVMDDPVNRSAMTSRADRELARDVFSSTIVNRLERNGEVWVTGAPWHEDDLYHAVTDEFPAARVYHFDAVKGVHGAHPAGSPLAGQPMLEPLCPERFGVHGERLLEKGYGRPMFNLKYRGNVKAFTGGVFTPPEYVTRAGLRAFGPLMEVSLGADFNRSTDEDADYTAIVTLGRFHAGQVVLLRAFREHMRTGWHREVAAAWDDAVNLARSYREGARVIGVRMENNSFQSEIRMNLHRDRPDVKAYPVDRTRNKEDRLSTALDPWFNVQDRFLILEDAPHGSDLRDEARAFPYGSTDDLLDAVDAALIPWTTNPNRRRLRSRT